MIKNVDLGTEFQFNGVLNSSCEAQHQLVVEKGFEKQPVGVLLMLIVSELSEALEADRNGKRADFSRFHSMYEGALEQGRIDGDAYPEEDAYMVAFEHTIKDTLEDEIADAFLRLMDFCGEMGIDIERHIQLKAAYNKLRPAKHGKAY